MLLILGLGCGGENPTGNASSLACAPNGAELVGEVAQYEDKYRLCYMRGPAGIIVALAEELS